MYFRRKSAWDYTKQAHGGLAQLARAPALQAGGHRFESDILHSAGVYKYSLLVLRHTVQTVNNRNKVKDYKRPSVNLSVYKEVLLYSY